MPWKRELRQKAQRFAFERGLRRCGIELYHEPNYVPISTDVPFVITIHDLSWLRYPETHPPGRIRWLKKGLPKAIRQRGDLVDSDFVRNELLSNFLIEPESVRTVHLGVSEEFHPRTASEVAPVLQPLPLTHGQYVLAVGTIEPRKNLVHIVKSHALLPQELRNRFPLVIAGAKGWHSSDWSACSRTRTTRKCAFSATWIAGPLAPLRRGRIVCIPVDLRGVWVAARSHGAGYSVIVSTGPLA